MVEQDWVRERFAEHHGRLQAVAFRILGSPGEAEDAVQEAWPRVSRADTSGVENPAVWLTTVVARVCLNMLEARRAQREGSSGALPPQTAAPHPTGQADTEDEALLADSVGVALMVVLDTLTPAERLAFVPHDVFAASFGEIGTVLDVKTAFGWPQSPFRSTPTQTGSATSTSPFSAPTSRRWPTKRPLGENGA
jgi:DNA-directed RNA polymerase specialized sigma24 family protein